MVLVRSDLKKYLQKQINEINREKWLEGEKIKSDPGESFVVKWIKERAQDFRTVYAQRELRAGIKHIDLTIKEASDSKIKRRLMVVRRCMAESLKIRGNGNGSSGK